MPSTLIELEDDHMGDGAENEEKEEDGGDGYVGVDCGQTTQAGGCGSIRGSSVGVG